eukprot:gene4742-5799_t
MAELESQMRSASLSERNGAVALCIGSSQHPYKREGVSTSGVDLRSKRRYRAALRGDEGLTDILKDVQTFKKVLEHLPDVELKNVPKRERDVLNVGIQAACLANEFSEGGIFTEVFAQKQLKRKNFMWQKLKAAHKGQEVQYPTFYCTWGGTSASSGDFEFHFFKRPTR